MAVQFQYPTAYTLRKIEMDKLPVLTEDDPIFDMFPIETSNTPEVIWEQRENYTGLMPARAMNAQAQQIFLPGAQRFTMTPGRYSAFTMLDEGIIEQSRGLGDYHDPLDLTEHVMIAQDRLLDNRLNRMRWILWTLLSTGAFTVPGPNGTIVTAGTYQFQTYTTVVGWNNFNNATPLADMRFLPILARGHSVRFDRASKAFMNRSTMNNLLQNNNMADLGGKRRDVGATFNSLDEVNQLVVANDVPEFIAYDEGYYTNATATTASTFVTFIPDNIVIVVGRRLNGDVVGNFQLTRNAANADAAPGPYTFVTDSVQSGAAPVPRTVRVDDGFNGAPVVFYPTAVIIVNVGGSGSGAGSYITGSGTPGDY